ncbi:hypothetical protein BDV25DRAFT_138785 [Aspergillus avenaceus]|uniref:Heterokaryon incompatibility domain-containing protein n=1 Tax=Aspergillus avenaceus TaxID=36643 RepID=A0A5N6TZM3_ASPAV|nr:hypothetical protein BDV25DRAFT_138785 [Aspergillus avenaceus]
MYGLRNVSNGVMDKATNSALYQGGSHLVQSAATGLDQLKKIALNPEHNHKLRQVLLQLVEPTIRPTFKDYGPISVLKESKCPGKWFALPAEDLKYPIRMIDLETENMVYTRSIGPQDQYCILSHSWKGEEITYKYFCDGMTSSRPTEEEETGDSSPDTESKHSDIQGVTYKCDKDLGEAIDKLQEKLPIAIGEGDEVTSVTELLERYSNAKEAKAKLERAERTLRDEEIYLASAEHESNHYRQLLSHVERFHYTTPTHEPLGDFGSGSVFTKLHAEVEGLLTKAGARRQKAEDKHSDARDANDAHKGTEMLFTNNRHVFYLVEDLLKALQRQRSARKLKKSIEVAKNIFEQMPYSKGGKRYVWLDTCCIDKPNAYELTESLALMGDWYSNADFCLVHLDTRRSDAEWLEEYKYVMGDTVNPVETNITHLGEVCADPDCWGDDCETHPVGKHHIEWAERGWTLQELVLSKMTYYVNSQWELLNRGIDSIGPYYPMGPFLERYLNHPQVRPDLDEYSAETGLSGYEYNTEPNMETIEALIQNLESLGFTPPGHISNMIAEAHIGQAVHSASDTREVNRLLAELQAEIRAPILKDREDIRMIGRLSKLANWAAGIDPSSSAARNVLVTASSRKTTTPTDQAYSLMGILGVQFPAFSAEGLPKALARLLDEVVITFNDVSVFNWSGKHAGTAIRGRSLYPSNINAFKNPIESPDMAVQAQTNIRILELFQADRRQQSHIAKDVVWLLSKMMKHIKDLKQDCPAAESLARLVKTIQDTVFPRLRMVVLDLQDIVDSLDEAILRIKERKDVERKEKEEKKEQRDKAGIWGSRDAINSGFGQLTGTMSAFSPRGLSAPMSLPTLGFKRSKAEKQVESDGESQEETLDAIEQEEPSSPTEEETVREKIENLERKLDAKGNIAGGDYEPISKKKNKKEKSSDREPSVNKSKAQTEEQADANAQSVEADFPALEDSKTLTPQSTAPRLDSKSQGRERGNRLVCPNPIVVSSAGIRGVFDIQRIVVKMEDEEALRARVVNSIPGQTIDGWCTISTGFAVTLVAFSCDRDTLKQQLDMTEVIRSELGEKPNDHESSPQKPSALGRSQERLSDHEDSEDTLIAGEASQEKPAVDKNSEGEEAPGVDEILDKTTTEQKRVRRMINFIQERDLHAIAGEWVLARFSGVSGADWFLCRLELGSGSDLYGRRIATDAFSFRNAVPEEGLMDYWYQYMTDKKSRICHAAEMYIQRSIMWHGAQQNLGNLVHITHSKDPNDDEFEELLKAFGEGSIGKFVDVTVAAGQGAVGMGADIYAKFLQSRIIEGALKKVPSQLQAAVLDLDKGRHLFPVMFHSGTDVHMF